MKRLFVCAVVFLLVISFIPAGYPKGLSSIGFLTGYMKGDLEAKPDYEVVPLMLSFGFDLKPLARKIGIDTHGILEFQVEPFINPVLEPETNIETGVNLLVKYAFPLNDKLMPYVKFGAGPSFMGMDTREQSTRFNFVDTAGAGFSWFIKNNFSLDVEYRFRHLSNCSIDSPNKGIETHSVLLGFSYKFE